MLLSLNPQKERQYSRFRADFVGKNIPTHEGEYVKVWVKEIDNKDLVTLKNYSKA